MSDAGVQRSTALVVSEASADVSPVPFSEQYVTISKQEYIQLKWDAGYYREHSERWKSKYEGLRCEQEAEQSRRHVKLQESNRLLEAALNQALARVSQLEKQLYGRKSEKKSNKSEAANSNGAAGEPAKRRGAQPGAKGHGRTRREKLPRRVETVDVAPDARVCQRCGTAYAEMPQTENSEILEYLVEALVREVRRKKYVRRCQCDESPGVVTAPPAPRVIAKGLLGVSAWVEVLLSKYLYSRSTCNLLRELSDQGLSLSQGTVTDGLRSFPALFEPLLDQMLSRQMEDAVFHCDETGWKVYERIDGKTGNRWMLWVFESASVVIYRIEPTRSGDVPISHFSMLSDKLEQAFVVCDRYSAYKRLEREVEVIELSFCWAHVRRDFLDAATQYKQLESWMRRWLKRIGTLYHLQKRRQAHWDSSKSLADQNGSFARVQGSLERAAEKMKGQFERELAQASLDNAKRKVLSSLQNHWSGLTVFVSHPEVAADNNSAERALRNPVVLRKNCRGSGSQWSAALAAQMFSILQTVLMWNLNPRRWLTEYLNACAEHGGQAPPNLDCFIPWLMSDARRLELSAPLNETGESGALNSQCEAAPGDDLNRQLPQPP